MRAIEMANNTAKCIAECSRAVELDSTFVKPLLRRAECNQQSDKLEDALADYKKLCELDTKNASTYRIKVYVSTFFQPLKH